MSVYSYKIPSSGKVLWRFELTQNGKRYTKRGFKNKTEAKNHRLTYLAKLGNNEAIVPKKLDLATYLNNWIKEAQDNRDYRDTTHIKYQNQIKLIIPEIGHIKLCDLNISHVKRMRERLLKKYSPKYIASTEVVLKSALKEGEEHIGLSPLIISLIHYIEFLCDVPYRKIFILRGMMIENNKKSNISYTFYARDKNSKYGLNWDKIERDLKTNKLLKYSDNNILNFNWIKAKDLSKFIMLKIKSNPYYLVHKID